MKKQKRVNARKDKTKKKNKAKYKTGNWKEYNQALVNRGSLEFWIDKDIEKKWYDQSKKDSHRPKLYSDFTIKTIRQIGKLFNQGLRQTEGLFRSILKFAGIDLSVPDYSTICRRFGKLEICLGNNLRNGEKLVIALDSSGLKVYGEGEWKVRKHGYSKRRTWRKIHIGINTETGDIVASGLTENDIADNELVKELLNQIKSEIDGLAGDGGYDKRNVYEIINEKKIGKVLIPPQKNAKIWHRKKDNEIEHSRDKNLRQIRKLGRAKWKRDSGYHVRSSVENTFFRWKTILGDTLSSRKFENQVNETRLSALILNKMVGLGMPMSYPVSCTPI